MRTKPQSPDADQLLPGPEVGERRPGEARLALEVVVHPHEPRRATGRARRDALPLEDEDARAAPRQVEGEAGALDAGAHDDDVGRFDHAPIMRAPAGRKRVVQPTPSGYSPLSERTSQHGYFVWR